MVHTWLLRTEAMESYNASLEELVVFLHQQVEEMKIELEIYRSVMIGDMVFIQPTMMADCQSKKEFKGSCLVWNIDNFLFVME